MCKWMDIGCFIVEVEFVIFRILRGYYIMVMFI